MCASKHKRSQRACEERVGARQLLVVPRCASGRCVWLRSCVFVRIKQYVYFALKSEHVTAATMADQIGLAADEVSVRGSTIAGPRPKPFVHSWKIVCDTPGLTVDEQVDRVIERLGPYRSAIREVVGGIDDAKAVLQVVRYFGAWLADDEGEEEELTVVGNLEKLPGQHQLLGWHLRREVMEFLLDVNAEMNFDEYG